MTVEIDTANSGIFKSLSGLGLSGGKAYSFSTGNACTWDSVKVRVTDETKNVVTKGFRVQMHNSPPDYSEDKLGYYYSNQRLNNIQRICNSFRRKSLPKLHGILMETGCMI